MFINQKSAISGILAQNFQLALTLRTYFSQFQVMNRSSEGNQQATKSYIYKGNRWKWKEITFEQGRLSN